ncbi:hypothetical protein [uncultured Parabacteroides sp.]|nr:hypothetical protein [uncultured Parabacteroides sp.]
MTTVFVVTNPDFILYEDGRHGDEDGRCGNEDGRRGDKLRDSWK